MTIYNKRRCLERAQSMMSKEDDNLLRYACLGLRFRMEAITPIIEPWHTRYLCKTACQLRVLVQSKLAVEHIDKRQTIAYIIRMKYLNWDPKKNEILKQERGFSFEEIAYSIESGQILGIEENSSRSNQKIYILEIDNYAIIVPYVENDNDIFLKTAFPSRKYTKRYGLRGEK